MDTPKVYQSLAARQAQEAGYGAERYWDYLEAQAVAMAAAGVADALTRTLEDALKGNNGD